MRLKSSCRLVPSLKLIWHFMWNPNLIYVDLRVKGAFGRGVPSMPLVTFSPCVFWPDFQGHSKLYHGTIPLDIGRYPSSQFLIPTAPPDISSLSVMLNPVTLAPVNPLRTVVISQWPKIYPTIVRWRCKTSKIAWICGNCRRYLRSLYWGKRQTQCITGGVPIRLKVPII